MPNCLILDLVCWLQDAMIYVMLSRVQCLDQLFILESLPEAKMKPFPEALVELERLNSMDISKPQELDSFHLKIVSLNARSLNAHMKDIKADLDLLSFDVICLQETWLNPFQSQTEKYSIELKQMQLNSKGHGKGVATYYPPNFDLFHNICEETFQITSVTSTELTIVNLYRSSNSNDDSLIEKLNELFSSDSKSIVLCGDMNFCQRDEMNHPVLTFLKRTQFIQALDPPRPTQRDGRCLDQIHFRLNKNIEVKTISIEPSYFSDHDKISIIVYQNQL